MNDDGLGGRGGSLVELDAGKATEAVEGWAGWGGSRPGAETRWRIGCRQMTLKCRVDQGTGRRAVEGCVSVKLNGNAGNTRLAANAQIQRLQYVIELTQIVGDQMNSEVGRLFHWIHPEQAGDVESGRRTMRLQPIDLNSAPTLEVLGIDCSAERKLGRDRSCREHSSPGRRPR